MYLKNTGWRQTFTNRQQGKINSYHTSFCPINTEAPLMNQNTLTNVHVRREAITRLHVCLTHFIGANKF